MRNQVNRRGAAGRILSASVLGASLASAFYAAPARAADDGQGSILGSLMSMVGLDSKPDPAEPRIDYRARSPLVLPKSDELPPPAALARRNSNWPKDPDVMAQRRAEALSRAPAQQPGQDTAMDFRDMEKDRSHGPAALPPSYQNCEEDEHECDPHQLWASLRVKKGDAGAIPNGPTFAPGKEPKREYLTEPPPGYMTPTQVVKRTWELPKNRDADDNSNVYWAKQAGHKVTDDAPSDGD